MKLPQTFNSIALSTEDTKELQTLLKLALFYKGAIDGIWGKMTDRAVELAAEKFWLNTYSKKLIGSSFINRLTEYGQKVQQEIKNNPKILTLVDFEIAADKLGVSIPHLKAVVEVESNGSGFLADGRPKILFEAHHFSRFTNHRYDTSYPQISSRRWNRKLYRGNEAEYSRLALAARLNKTAAFLSYSTGAFQIMGFNYGYCGCSNVFEFQAKNKTARGQLNCFVEFILSKSLNRAMKNEDWRTFAYYYNGSGYRANRYDERLKRAFAKHKYRNNFIA